MGFWTALLDDFHAAFPETKACTAEDFYRYVNKCKAGFIRVDADELTYSMHVVLRFEIEELLVAGEVEVDELPKLWRSKMVELLGVEPPTDALGVLQDVHWSDGSFGYFGSYTLGAMFAAQWHAHMKKEIPDLDALVAAGDFAPIREWLRARIHRVGSLHASADELCEAVTGSKLDPSVYVEYLQAKYARLYGC